MLMAVLVALAVLAFAIAYSPRCGENDKDSIKIGGTVLVAGCNCAQRSPSVIDRMRPALAFSLDPSASN